MLRESMKVSLKSTHITVFFTNFAGRLRFRNHFYDWFLSWVLEPASFQDKKNFNSDEQHISSKIMFDGRRTNFNVEESSA